MGRSEKKLTLPAIAVLNAVARGHRYGFDIMDATSLASGTVYPILGRLADAGLVTARWERSEAARNAKRPARKYYGITEAGEGALTDAVDHYRTLGGIVPLSPEHGNG